jgi:hypothetical protein
VAVADGSSGGDGGGDEDDEVGRLCVVILEQCSESLGALPPLPPKTMSSTAATTTQVVWQRRRRQQRRRQRQRRRLLLSSPEEPASSSSVSSSSLEAFLEAHGLGGRGFGAALERRHGIASPEALAEATLRKALPDALLEGLLDPGEVQEYEDVEVAVEEGEGEVAEGSEASKPTKMERRKLKRPRVVRAPKGFTKVDIRRFRRAVKAVPLTAEAEAAASAAAAATVSRP